MQFTQRIFFFSHFVGLFPLVLPNEFSVSTVSLGYLLWVYPTNSLFLPFRWVTALLFTQRILNFYRFVVLPSFGLPNEFSISLVSLGSRLAFFPTNLLFLPFRWVTVLWFTQQILNFSGFVGWPPCSLPNESSFFLHFVGPLPFLLPDWFLLFSI